MDAYQQFIFTRTYARWLPGHNRRETWEEAVDRLCKFYVEIAPQLPAQDHADIKQAVLNMECLPSMRLLSMAGEAVHRNNLCAYNCSYLPVDCIDAFAECLLILMNGTGVGFSVETEYVDKLPRIVRQKDAPALSYKIEDSTDGWVDALHTGMQIWFSGGDVTFDYSSIRPEGSPLRTKGGYSSGQGPLQSLLEFIRDRLLANQSRRLEPIDCHDIVCRIGETVCMGNVRRAALISLSDLDDVAIRGAKDGQFWLKHPYRTQSNNSAVYNSKPPAVEFLTEWLSLAKSGSGERGIFNRGGVIDSLPARRQNTGDYGGNPCLEIVLRPMQLCNLSEVVARTEDDEFHLLRKVRLATIMGTIQATLTHFPGLRPEWKQNCEEERLLGVSLTGIMDCSAVRSVYLLEKLRAHAIEVNKKYAALLKINQSAAITCVKPSGTVSQLVNSSSGIHCRWSQYYIRRIRISALDPLFAMMKDIGVPHFPEVGQSSHNASIWVLEFPVKSPDGATTRHDLTALDQLESWLVFKGCYTEHNPSATIYVGAEEWVAVGSWVYDNWDQIGGLSFLPKTDYVYNLAPYEEITRREYEKRVAEFPTIDYNALSKYEQFDQTTSEMEMACVGGACEIH